MTKVKIKTYSDSEIKKYRASLLNRLLKTVGIASTISPGNISRLKKSPHVRIDPKTGEEKPWKITQQEKTLRRSLAGTAESVLTRLFPKSKKRIRAIRRRFK